MFAVFEHTDTEWYTLPHKYRESALYTADKDVEELTEATDQPAVEQPHNSNIGSTGPGTYISRDVNTEPNWSSTEVGQLPQKRKHTREPAKEAANKARAALQQLKELTYLSQNTEVLQAATRELQSLVTKISASIPKSNEGMYLRTSPKKRRRGTARKEKKEKLKNVGSIGKHRKPGQRKTDWHYRNRVGKRASILKKTFKVDVPIPVSTDKTVFPNAENKPEPPHENSIGQTPGNWRDVHRKLLIPAELACLNPNGLLNDQVIDSYFQ